jgi:acetyl-CoA acetyltransferase
MHLPITYWRKGQKSRSNDAGNASGVKDGAAASLLANEKTAKSLASHRLHASRHANGRRCVARDRDRPGARDAKVIVGLSMTIDQFDVIELNEAVRIAMHRYDAHTQSRGWRRSREP